MTDNKNKKGKQDAIRVNANDKSEVEYLHRQFPKKTHEEVVAAIKAAGPYRAAIIMYLETH